MIWQNLLLAFFLFVMISCGSKHQIKFSKEAIKVSTEESPTMLFVGDSLTAGYGVDTEYCFVGLFAKKFTEARYKIQVKNAGISGDTSSGVLSRIDFLLQSKPLIVFLNIGSNDGFRGQKAELFEKNLEAIIKKILATKASLILSGIRIPINYGLEYSNKMASVPSDLAKKYQLPYYPFLLEGVAMRADLNLDDAVHPNEKGHHEIFLRLDKFFAEISLYQQIQALK